VIKCLAVAELGDPKRHRGRVADLDRLAHDLREPLNAIALNVELLRVLPPEHPSREKKLAAIQGSVEAMRRLIDDEIAATAAPR